MLGVVSTMRKVTRKQLWVHLLSAHPQLGGGESEPAVHVMDLPEG